MKGWFNSKGIKNGVWKQYGRYGGYPISASVKEKYTISDSYSLGEFIEYLESTEKYTISDSYSLGFYNINSIMNFYSISNSYTISGGEWI